MTGYGDEQALVVQDVAGGQALEVFRGEVFSESPPTWSPRWSRDGARILVVAGGTADVGWAAYAVPRLGGTPRRLSLDPIEEPVWSADGTRVAGLSEGSQHIHVTDTVQGDTTAIPLAEEFPFKRGLDWSPSGDFFVVGAVDAEGQSVLWTVSVDGRAQSRIVRDVVEISSPRWSPDGDAIYYWRDDPESGGIWKIDVSARDGTALGPPRLLLAGVPVRPPLTVSADGTRLLYRRQQSQSNLWVMDLDVQGAAADVGTTRLTTGTLGDADPSVSPDGQRVAFSRGDGRTRDIFVVPIEGGQPQRITFLDAVSRSPAWSPDGREIAFGSTAGGTPQVWKVSGAGGTPTSFDDSAVSVGTFKVEWAPGSAILYHRPGHRNFGVLDPTTGALRPLIADDSVGWAFNPQYSPDGAQVAVYWNRPNRGVWLISLDDASEQLLYPLDRPNLLPLAWPADGLYAIDGASEPRRVTKLPATGGAPVALAPMPWNAGACDTVDGRRYVCSRGKGQSDVWLVENFDPDR